MRRFFGLGAVAWALLGLVAVCGLHGMAWGQEANSTVSEPEYVEPAPVAGEGNSTVRVQVAEGPGLPVLVEHLGDDELGLRLGLFVKEAVVSSPLFTPGAAGAKAMKIVLRTRPLFRERPDMGSQYAVAWLYVEGPDVLAYYLDGAAGQVLPGGEKATALTILSLTDKVAGRFGYLFASGRGGGVSQ